MAGAQRGRPRSETTREAILTATRDLLLDGGYDALTYDAIARAAESSRQTLYRWWPTKALLVADAVIAGTVEVADAEVADTGDLSADLTQWLQRSAERSSDPLTLQLVRALAGAAAADDERAEALYAHLTGRHHARLVARIASARDRGDVAHEIDPVTTADALLGIPLLHALTGRAATLDPARVVRSLVH